MMSFVRNQKNCEKFIKFPLELEDVEHEKESLVIQLFESLFKI
jgi:hypothetical protein